MAANFETGFFGNRTPAWHGLGVVVEGTLTSADAIHTANLGWTVMQKEIYTSDGILIPDYKANVRDSDNTVLGVVGNRYKIVQNTDAFAFTDDLIGEGVRYETAGSLNKGRTIFLLAVLPKQYEILGDKVDPYIVFTNSHDGSGAVRCAMTPIRVVCQNTLNAALGSAKRIWSARHTGNIDMKMADARETLGLATVYMETLQSKFEELNKVKLDDGRVGDLIKQLSPVTESMTEKQKANALKVQQDIWFRYYTAPDLEQRDKSGARFVQAVADTASHMEPLRRTKNYDENFFGKMILGNDLLDKAIKLVA